MSRKIGVPVANPKGMFNQPCESCPVMIGYGKCSNEDCSLFVKPVYNFTRTETWHLNGEVFDVGAVKDKIERQKRERVFKQLQAERREKELEHLTKRISENEAILAAFENAQKGERK